jgi:hypothetical protein
LGRKDEDLPVVRGITFHAVTNPDEPVAAKRKSRFIGELKIAN